MCNSFLLPPPPIYTLSVPRELTAPTMSTTSDDSNLTIKEACELFKQADLNFTMAAAEGHVDQSELDKLFKLSTESWNGSANPLVDEIAARIAEEKSDEALQLYKDWKSAYRNEILGDSSRTKGFEDYSNDFEGELDISSLTLSTAVDAENCAKYNSESSSIITAIHVDDGEQSFDLALLDATAENEASSSSQTRSVINGDFYGYVNGPTDDGYISKEWGCECIECVMDEMHNASIMDANTSKRSWSATNTSMAAAAPSPSKDDLMQSEFHISYSELDTTIGAVAAGLPFILITNFSDPNQKPNQNPRPVDIQAHFASCKCWDCFLYKSKALEPINKVRLNLPTDDINTGAIATGLPLIAISDHDKDRELEWVHTHLNGAKPEPIAKVIVRIMKEAACIDDQRRVVEVEQVEDEISMSDDHTDMRVATADEDDWSSRSVATSELTVESIGQAVPLYEQVSSTSPSPDTHSCQSKSDGAAIVKQVVAAAIAVSLLTIFVPAWVLAGVVVGLALARR